MFQIKQSANVVIYYLKHHNKFIGLAVSFLVPFRHTVVLVASSYLLWCAIKLKGSVGKASVLHLVPIRQPFKNAFLLSQLKTGFRYRCKRSFAQQPALPHNQFINRTIFPLLLLCLNATLTQKSNYKISAYKGVSNQIIKEIIS